MCVRLWAPRSWPGKQLVRSDEVEQSVEGGVGCPDGDGLSLGEGSAPEFQEHAQAGAVAEAEPAQVQLDTAGRGGEGVVQLCPDLVARDDVEFTAHGDQRPGSVRFA